MRHLKLGDLLLLSLVVGSSLLFTIKDKVAQSGVPTDGVTYVEVRVAGKRTMLLTEPGTATVRGHDGKYVTTLHFDGERAWVENSSCPDKLCEKMGKVGVGGSIICVPNRTVIEVKGSDSGEVKIDVQTW